jgi:hypothetical protein
MSEVKTTEQDVLFAQAAEVGISNDTLNEVWKIAGKIGLQLLIALKKKRALASATFIEGEMVSGDSTFPPVTPLPVDDKTVFGTLLEKLWPLIVEKLIQKFLTADNLDTIIQKITDMLFDGSKSKK